jgi:hypothetical protein
LHSARHSQNDGEKELVREMLFNIALNAHQKLKLRLVSQGFLVGFGSGVTNGVTAEAIRFYARTC